MTLYTYKPESCVWLMYVIIFTSEELWGHTKFRSLIGVIH